MGYHNCKKCSRLLSRYTIDRPTEDDEYKNYRIKLCWGCGYFSIYPNVIDEFTSEIMKNKMLIIELIEDKLLRPIL